MKRRLFIFFLYGVCILSVMRAQNSFSGYTVADEGAWCWFADPRAIHYENATGTINMTYIGYIDVHGNVKATQYDWLSGRKTDVLVRSYFQPDDHNNPTFLVLPDERVLIIYSRHTDEAAFYYRVSVKPGDITALGAEKKLVTSHNTTYPSPFILSDDPDHWYLCWRGINWHPTIARLTMPDENDNVSFDFGPKQIVQSTGARPYCKYQSNGKDKIYLSYTTGHPDNEMPDWLYFNVIDINKGNGPILRDINGTQLKVISDGAFNVNKTDSYAANYPLTIVDKTANIRNWVWQVVLDENERPVVAYPHIDSSKDNHAYWYSRWTGTAWRNTWVQHGGHAFHQSWTSTEKCYSGGMALDPEHVNDLYLSIPTANGTYDKNGVYEIWKYTIDDDGSVAGSEQLTYESEKNNIRPYVLPGSASSDMRLLWMNGDYYYWMVRKGYPQGFPTSIRTDYEWNEEPTPMPFNDLKCICLLKGRTLNLAFAMDADNYGGTLFSLDDGTTYAINKITQKPELTINGKTYTSENRLLTSDDWATLSSGTSGDNHPTKLTTWVLTVTYDGQTLTTYRNGFVDQVIEVDNMEGGTLQPAESSNPHAVLSASSVGAVYSPMTVHKLVYMTQKEVENKLDGAALEAISLPTETRTDLVLPTTIMGKPVDWRSSDESLMMDNGALLPVQSDSKVTMIATIGSLSKPFEVNLLKRDIVQNLRLCKEEVDLTANKASAFSTNSYGHVEEGMLKDLRSFTFLLTMNANSLVGQPRLYDFGSGSGNSLFLRANPLAAGVKYNGGTTTMVNGTTSLQTGNIYQLAVTYSAATKTTTIYVDGEVNASGTQNQAEAYQLYQIAKDVRNYIGRTQWWDGSYAADNQDFIGLISDFRLYDIALTRQEICQEQGLSYEQKELPSALVNGGFEDSYSAMSGSGVSSDRAIYVPYGWTVDYSNRNNNDLTALKSGDLYFSNFFASRPSVSAESKQTYWIRQNWGASTITLLQELRLPAGTYSLTADVWKSGNGGDVIVSVISENGQTFIAPTIADKVAWQQVGLNFTSDGNASSTVSLSAVHTTNGSEKIIGFDNVTITNVTPTSVMRPSVSSTPTGTIYDIHGRRISSGYGSAIVIENGNKHIQKR